MSILRCKSMGRQVASIAVLALGFRALSAAVAFMANVVFPDYQPEQFTVFRSTSLFWDSFARYDSGWYYGIARYGYTYTPGGRSSIAFLPVYPWLMRHVGRVFGRTPADLFIGGIVVSWLAFAVAMVGLYHLAQLDLRRRQAVRAVVLAAVFPFAFFFGAVYTEALFLAATVMTFYAFRTRRWLAGGLAGAVATATRINGVMMWPALAWMVWRAVGASPKQNDTGMGRSPQRDRFLAVLGLALVPAGIGGYSVFIYQLTGNPFEWVATVARWDYHPGGAPWLPLVRLVRALVHPYAFITGGGMAPYDTLNGLTALVFVLAVPLVWRRLGAPYGLLMACNLWLPLSSGKYEGMGRYCAVLFPFFIWLASFRSAAVFTAIVTVSALLYALCMAMFTNIHPLY